MKILSFDVGIVNLAYCVFDSITCKIDHWEVITLDNHTDYNKVYINLIKQLDLRKHLISGINVVLIEKQPSFNPKMRIVAGCLQTYFILRGIVDNQESPISAVKFFSPKHKLKCHTGPEIKIESKNGKQIKSKYSRTKKMGVIICREKLNFYGESPEILKLFDLSKKKDDLSDCYLQALTYCTFEKLIKKTIVLDSIPEPIKLNKIQIKAQLKELLEVSDASMELDCVLNDLSSLELKSGITDKFGFSFPMDQETISDLLGKNSLKTLAKKFK